MRTKLFFCLLVVFQFCSGLDPHIAQTVIETTKANKEKIEIQIQKEKDKKTELENHFDELKHFGKDVKSNLNLLFGGEAFHKHRDITINGIECAKSTWQKKNGLFSVNRFCKICCPQN